MLAFGNSIVCQRYIEVISPTIDFESGSVSRLPWVDGVSSRVSDIAKRAVHISKNDWSSKEENWEFSGLSILDVNGGKNTFLSDGWDELLKIKKCSLEEIQELEQENDQLFIDAFKLSGELVPDLQWRNNGQYSVNLESEMQRLISYAIGCIMGRYSLDEPGLIYANSGNINFDSSRYSKLPVDADGIVPITDESWFADDAAERVREFVKVVWSADTLVENMEWLADSLGRKAGESADEAIRRYLSTSFYKDHLQTYKKRPIYWLFSSGKQKAFECLVYLHRYNEGTLSRMRMEYVVPLQSRMQARIDKLTDDIDSATSSAQQKALQKRKDKLTKQLEELRRFDENLRPYADQRITLDLDDGVKVNYGKFGNLLAEVKAITGGKDD